MLVEDYSALFLLSLINSSLLNRYFKIRFPITDVDGYMLHQIPIRRVDFTTPAAKRAAQLGKAKRLYEKSLTDDEPSALHFIQAELQVRRTDVVHDLLAFLAKRMMAMNRQKRTTAKRFVTDLKDFHGIDIRALSPKTKLDEFWELEAGDVFTHFRTNKVRISQSDEEKIRERFSKAKSLLVPLDSQIAFTDRFIDQIVYRLYGLTPEEIKIVESAFTKKISA
jgi:hypothetical protein